MDAAGLYLPGDGMVHRWHPLTKLSLLLATILVAFVPWQRNPRLLLVPVVLVVPFGVLAFVDGGDTVRVWMRRLFWLIFPIAVSLVLVQGFFYPGAEDIMLRIGPLALKREGLMFAATIGGRLLLILAGFMLVLLTTCPADLTTALTQVGLPSEVAYLVLAALQLIPRMQARGQTIAAAQQARGLETGGNLLRRVRGILPLFGPLILGALGDVEERAMALEARAFRASRTKTSLRTLHDSTPQRIVRWVLVVGGSAVLVYTRFF